MTSKPRGVVLPRQPRRRRAAEERRSASSETESVGPTQEGTSRAALRLAHPEENLLRSVALFTAVLHSQQHLCELPSR